MLTHKNVNYRIFPCQIGNRCHTGDMKQYRIREYHSKSRPDLKFVVNFKNGPKRSRRFFKTKSEAATFALTKKIAHENTGREGAEFPSSLRVMATAADALLKPYEKNIMDAVEFYLPHLQASNRTCTFRELVAELLPAKKADGASGPYLGDLRCRLGQFSSVFGDRLMSEIKCDEIDDWLRGLDVSPVTRNNSRRALRTAFSFAVARKYCIDNEAAKTAKAKEIEGTVGILTVAETARLLEAADAALVPFIAIGAFAGLRRAELERLDWSEVDLESGLITVQAVKAKSARRRFVKIRENLAAWLAPYAARRGMVTPSNCRKMLEATRGTAGIKHWPSNALRHSFASYHLAHFNDAAALALELGHTDAGLVFQHYRQIVKPKDAERYWNLFPSAGASSSKVVSIA
jgi:integrase